MTRRDRRGPPASSSESWGENQYRFWYHVDAMSCEPLFAWAQALEDVDRDLAAKYATEARQFRDDIRCSVERSIVLTPLRKLRSGVWRSYSPGVCYARGPFISFWGGSGYGCEDFCHQHVLLRSWGWAPGDEWLAGSLEVPEDRYLFRQYNRELADRRQKRGNAARDDSFWGGISRPLGYHSVTDAHLFRDNVAGVSAELDQQLRPARHLFAPGKVLRHGRRDARLEKRGRTQ